MINTPNQILNTSRIELPSDKKMLSCIHGESGSRSQGIGLLLASLLKQNEVESNDVEITSLL